MTICMSVSCMQMVYVCVDYSVSICFWENLSSRFLIISKVNVSSLLVCVEQMTNGYFLNNHLSTKGWCVYFFQDFNLLSGCQQYNLYTDCCRYIALSDLSTLWAQHRTPLLNTIKQVNYNYNDVFLTSLFWKALKSSPKWNYAVFWLS